jgi:hypothetical protein
MCEMYTWRKARDNHERQTHLLVREGFLNGVHPVVHKYISMCGEWPLQFNNCIRLMMA